MVTHTFLEEAIEDALMSLSEDGFGLPKSIDIVYSEEEYEKVERFHRLRYIKSKGRMGITKDRWPFIRLQLLGVSVNVIPEPKPLNSIH